MNKIYFYIFCVLVFSLTCCKRNNTTPTPSFTKASYPLAVGNWWKYELTSITFAPDTFTLRVDSMINLGTYTKYVCHYVIGDTIMQAGYFLQTDSSMSFIQPYGYYTSFPSFYLKFPVNTGQLWSGDFPGDTTHVVGVANDCVGALGQGFSPCYSEVESYDLPHNFKVNRMLLTPKIGLITQSIDFKSDTAGIQIQQSVSLISYHVQ